MKDLSRRENWSIPLQTPIRRERALTAYRAGTDLVAKLAFLALTMLAARRLSRDAFGAFALGATLGWMAGIVTDAGLQMHLAREVARREPSDAAAVFRRWLGWRLAGAALALLAVGAVLAARPTGAPDAVALAILVAGYLVNALTEFVNHLFRGLSRTDLESTITASSRLAVLALGAAGLWWWPSLATLALAITTVACVTLAVSVRTAWRLLDATGRPTVPDARPAVGGWPLSRGREFLHDVLPVGVGVVLSALYFRIDVLLIEHYRGLGAVGAYNGAYRLIDALRLVPAAALAVALPALCRAGTTQPMIRLALPLTALALAACAPLWLAAHWVIAACLGSGFADAVPAFRILLLAFPLMTVNYVLTTQLVAWDRHLVFAGLCAGALAVNLALNVALVPAQSIAGASWATVWTEVVIFVGSTLALATAPAARRAGLSEVAAS